MGNVLPCSGRRDRAHTDSPCASTFRGLSAERTIGGGRGLFLTVGNRSFLSILAVRAGFESSWDHFRSPLVSGLAGKSFS